MIGATRRARAATATTGNGAAFFPAAAVAERFGPGGLLLDTAGYKIDAGRREAPGEVEYHAHTVDVMHVLEGNATVVTGGEMRDVARGRARRAARRRRSTAASAHELRRGDVLAIPNGVPHQFVDVSRAVPVLRREGGGVDGRHRDPRRRPPRAVPGPPELLPGRPGRVVDLQTDEGAALVGGPVALRRRARSARSTSSRSRGPDADPLGPGDVPEPDLRRRAPRRGRRLRRLGLADARARGHDAPARATGGCASTGTGSTVTIPERVGDTDSTGATVVFEVVVDDYAEVWVNGELPLVLGDDRRPRRRRLQRAQPRRAYPRRPARRAVPDRRLRHQRPDLRLAAQLHLDAFGDARPLRPERVAAAELADCASSAPTRASMRSCPTTRGWSAWPAASSSPRARSGRATARCCSARRTRTRSTASSRTPAASPCSAPRAATAASTSAATTSPAPTASRSTRRAAWRSASTATAA